jgi:cytochrome P450
LRAFARGTYGTSVWIGGWGAFPKSLTRPGPSNNGTSIKEKMKHSIDFGAATVALVVLFSLINGVAPLTLRSTRTIGGRPDSFGTIRSQRLEVRNGGRHFINKEFSHSCGPINKPCSTRLHASVFSPLTKAVGIVSPSVRNAVLLVAAVLAILNRQQILFPGTSPDSKYSEPLPPGSFGCPFFGHNIFKTTSEGGPGEFFRQTSAKLGNSRIFKYMFVGQPIVSVAGMRNVKKVFNNEFKSIQTRLLQSIFGYSLFGKESLIMSTDSEEHSFLRRLVGAAMTPDSIDKAIPSLQKSVTEQIDKILLHPTAVMEDICTNFTLDVAWRQILGLNLEESEIPSFYQAVNNWILGLFDLRLLFLPGGQYTKAGRAHTYLVSLINKKIDDLNRKGPDGSTLSAMVFAKDEFDGKKLSRQQVIDNSLLLILAGSETTASTLTTGVLLLGLHPDVFQKMKEEQQVLAAKDGGVLSLRQIDKECPYLDAVTKEIMRIKPLPSGGAMRYVKDTLVVDGVQIPKGYRVGFNVQLTHAYDPVTYVPDWSHMDAVKGFKPERWLSESTKPSEFMPFGYGPRYCLGANLAIAEMKVFLSLFARRVDFDLVNMSKDNVTWQTKSILPKPEDGSVIAPRPSSLNENKSRTMANVLV